jgi:hypothetical protein
MRERRRTLRYPFVATAELIEEKSKTQLSVRVTELSLYGCYFDAVNPFPTSTPVLVKIFRGLEFFEARGVVLYAQATLGMGVGFEKVHPFFLKILHGWLREAENAPLKLVGEHPQDKG